MPDNNQIKGIARPAVIVAAIRSGGTFLAHCLSNHPQIFCERGEPMHHRSIWCTSLHPNRRELLAALLNQTGYPVSACKLTYVQAFHRHIWPWLETRRPHVIWLRRENTLRQAVSALLNARSRSGALKLPQHSFERPNAVRVEIAPESVLAMARKLASRDQWAQERLSGWSVLPLSYEGLTGGREAVALPADVQGAICTFLGVRNEAMGADLVKINRAPLREILGNWTEVRAVVRRSEFAKWLEAE